MSANKPSVSFHDGFHESLARLQPVEQSRVNEALLLFKDDPDHRGLNLHPVQGARRGFMSVRASKELRVIVYQRGGTFVWLFADHHDDAYERAGRLRFYIDPNDGIPIISSDEPTDDQVWSRSSHDTHVTVPTGYGSENTGGRSGVLDHWADPELERAGFDETEREQLRRLTNADDVLTLIDLWPEERLDTVFEMVEQTPEQFFDTALFEDAREEAAEERLRDAINRFGALAGLSPLFDEEELERIASAPIEEWMMFLHPDQRSLVDREFNGPARVRGAAGTGKTVVALHRAASLAKRYGPGDGRILVTTYIRSLPPVLEQLYRRLPAGDSVNIDFINVDRLAFQICNQAGLRPHVDPRAVDAAFASAYKKIVTEGSPLDRARLTRDYLKEEIRAVIKGRGITDLDTYMDLKRTGRRTQFGPALREQAWELKGAWDSAMANRGTEDFHDVVLRARDLVRQRSAPTYRAVLIDEAQDLTLVALQMLRSLVNGRGEDRPDGLFIAGDGAQRIYAGGFTLRQAGVEVRGRTSVLRTNYRNTHEIFSAAMSVAGSDEIEDLDETFRRDEETADPERSGAPVELLTATDTTGEIRAVVSRLRELLDDDDMVGPGDVGVCCVTNHQAKVMRRGLEEAGLSTQDLKDYDGTPNDHVKVGTHHRSKGLEFKVVFLPGLTAGEFPRPAPQGMDLEEYQDQLALQTSALFVAMTRARDRLILSTTGSPSPILAPLLERLECHSA